MKRAAFATLVFATVMLIPMATASAQTYPEPTGGCGAPMAHAAGTVTPPPTVRMASPFFFSVGVQKPELALANAPWITAIASRAALRGAPSVAPSRARVARGGRSLSMAR